MYSEAPNSERSNTEKRRTPACSEFGQVIAILTERNRFEYCLAQFGIWTNEHADIQMEGKRCKKHKLSYIQLLSFKKSTPR